MKSRGMVILISDLLDDTTEVLNALRHFQHKKHDVIVFHVLDDSELDLPYEELANFRDVETGSRLAVDPAAFRPEYRRRINAFCDELDQGCLRTNIDYHLVRTSEPLEKVLSSYLKFRMRRAR